MTYNDFHQFTHNLPGVESSYPFKGECIWLKVHGKLFALSNVKPMRIYDQDVPPFHFINLKCDPDYALELRATYHTIVPAWHQNKTHWNTLYLDGSIPDQLLIELIEHAYRLVVASLPKKIQNQNCANERDKSPCSGIDNPRIFFH
jgi:predicted DNA-binding protein (MmcQ/YjbR family)